MAGLLSSAMLTELQAATKSVFAVITITLPGGTAFRIAVLPVSVATVGQSTQYNSKVVNWASITRQLSTRDGSLQLSTAGVTFEDTDRTFSNNLATWGIEAMRGAAFGIALGSVNVTPGNWYSAFVGTVDTVKMDSPHVWTVTAQSAQQALREGRFPKTPVLQGDFPNVYDKAIYSFRVPIIYGVHDSRGSGDTGLVPCLYVDTLGFRYLVSQGWVTCDRVYSAGVLKTVTSDYTVDHTTINGRLYTLVNFISDQGTNEVTADVTGFESVGNGSGTTLTGTDALAHLLTNFVYGDYQGGNWASTTTNINSTYFSNVQTILTTLGSQKVSMRFGGDEDGMLGMDAVNSFCRTLRLDAFWTNLGKLGLAFNNPFDTTLYYSDPRLARYDRDELAPLGLDWDNSRFATRILASFLFGPAAGSFMQKLEVKDCSASEDVQTQLNLTESYRSLL